MSAASACRRAASLAWLAAALIAFSERAAAQDRPHEALTLAITQLPASLHPLITGHVAKRYLLAMALRPLWIIDKDWKSACTICAAPPVVQGKLVTMTIHPRAAWGDGEPVTTKDVVFAWEVGRHPESGVADPDAFRAIEAVDVTDDRTFTLHLKESDYSLKVFYLLPGHLEAPIFAASARDYGRRSLYNVEPTNPGLYIGPYEIVEFVPGERVVLERNPGWYGAPPYFKRITVKLLADTGAAERELRSGAIDYLAGEVGLSLEQVLDIEARHRDEFRFLYKPALTYEHLAVNLDQPILADKRVRQALLLAIDRDAISKQVYGGKNPVADTFSLPEEHLGEAGVHKYPFDPVRARQLLDEAGWSAIEDGIRHNGAGARLSFTFMTTAGNRSRELTQQLIAAQWRAIGVETRLQNEPTSVLFDTVLRQRKFDGVVLMAWFRGPFSIQAYALRSSQIPTSANNYAGQNYVGFRGADAIFDELLTGADPDRIERLHTALQDIYTEELPEIPLYFRAEAYVLPHWLEGVEPTGHFDPSTNRVEYWRAK